MITWMRQEDGCATSTNSLMCTSVVSTMSEDDDTLAETIINETKASGGCDGGQERKVSLCSGVASREQLIKGLYDNRPYHPTASDTVTVRVSQSDFRESLNQRGRETHQLPEDRKISAAVSSSVSGVEMFVHRGNLNLKTDTVMGKRGFNGTIFTECIEEWSGRYESAKANARRSVAMHCLQEMYNRGCRFLIPSTSNHDDSSTTTSRSDVSCLYVPEIDNDKITEKIVRTFRRYNSERMAGERQQMRAIVSNSQTNTHPTVAATTATNNWTHASNNDVKAKASNWSTVVSPQRRSSGLRNQDVQPDPVSLGRVHSLYCPGDDDDVQNPLTNSNEAGNSRRMNNVWNPSNFFDDQQQQQQQNYTFQQPSEIPKVSVHCKMFQSLDSTSGNKASQAVSPETVDLPFMKTSQDTGNGSGPAYYSVSHRVTYGHNNASQKTVDSISAFGSTTVEARYSDHHDSITSSGDEKYEIRDDAKASHNSNLQDAFIGRKDLPASNLVAHRTVQTNPAFKNFHQTSILENGPINDTMNRSNALDNRFGIENFVNDKQGVGTTNYQVPYIIHQNPMNRGLAEPIRRPSNATSPQQKYPASTFPVKSPPPSYITTNNFTSASDPTMPTLPVEETAFYVPATREERMNMYRQWLREGCAGSGEVPAIRHKVSIDELNARFEEVERRAEALGRHNQELLNRITMLETSLTGSTNLAAASRGVASVQGSTPGKVAKAKTARAPKRKAAPVSRPIKRPAKRGTITKETIKRLEARQNMNMASAPIKTEYNANNDYYSINNETLIPIGTSPGGFGVATSAYTGGQMNKTESVLVQPVPTAASQYPGGYGVAMSTYTGGHINKPESAVQEPQPVPTEAIQINEHANTMKPAPTVPATSHIATPTTVNGSYKNGNIDNIEHTGSPNQHDKSKKAGTATTVGKETGNNLCAI